jgi:choline-sulfatase
MIAFLLMTLIRPGATGPIRNLRPGNRQSPKDPFPVIALTQVGFFLVFNIIAAMAAPQPNLVLITVDTLRADHLGCYGYKSIQTPNMDRLASEGVRFETVVSQVPLTLPSHCTIMTGTYPVFHGVRDNVGYRLPESKTTLAAMLKNQHYQTAAFVGAYVLNAKFGLNQGFDHYDDKIDGTSRSGPAVNLNEVERPAGEVISRAMGWLSEQPRSPFFIWIHLYDPHDPYQPPSPFSDQYKAKPYDGEIAYADRELGRFMELLKEAGYYDNTLVVLTGDHGESFGEHKEWTHGYFIYDTTILVPLIIKPVKKGMVGRVVAEQVSLVDVAPTILQLMDLPRPTVLQGRGMLGLILGMQRDWPRLAYSETFYPTQFGWSPLTAVRRADVKFIRAPRPELYDLKEDPGEQTNRFEQRGALANALRASLSQMESAYSNRDPTRTSNLHLSGVDVENLRSLGYVGMADGSGAGKEISPGAADPKDKLAVYGMISAGSQDVAAGRYLEALPILQRVIQIEPGIRLARSMLGRCYFQLHEFELSKRAFQEILKQQPQNSDARFYVAACDYRLKDWTAAEVGLKKVLERDRDFASAHLYLGFLYQARGETALALAAFQRVLELEPENEDAHAKTGFLLASSGKVKDAVPHFQKVILLNPADGEAHFNLGVAYSKLGMQDPARRELAEACRLDRKYCGREH